ncbi:glycosyltransferase family 2 protein [Streptomyces sp. NBC_00536]|uniref:glycosyltransferase family 2 protein n=1 Tax=Streptomyces sp. NBC_00536 TaxID=2975769 RepID=UPI002E81E699|nr:glycosyltransferase family 2 protein [Streptomyces sp. NBC_00536]WUC79874.1 glycosyltransferase family 2 protein [Streptomyces sp. NBC_00536]
MSAPSERLDERTGATWPPPVRLSVILRTGGAPAARTAPLLARLRADLDARAASWPGGGAWELLVVTPEEALPQAPADPQAPDAQDAPQPHADPRVRTAPTLRAAVRASTGRRILFTDTAHAATGLHGLDRLQGDLDDLDHAPGTTAMVSGRHRGPLVRALGIPGPPGFRADTLAFALFDGGRARAAFAASALDGPAVDAEVLRWCRAQGWATVERPVERTEREHRPVREPRRGDRMLGLRFRELFRLNAGGLAVAAFFVALSFLLFHRLWLDLDGAYLRDALQDQNQWEWFVGVTTDNITHLRNPLFTTAQGMPDGVNLMANATMLGLTVPLIPVTLAFGATVTFVLVLTLGMAASGWTWYWLIRRRLVRSRWAAASGGAVAAFAPPMISHANGHPNFVVLFMIPLIIDRALRLCDGSDGGRAVVRDGVLLGLFATYQIFIGEEPLLITALGLVVFALACLVVDRERVREAWRPLGLGVAIALAVCLPLVIYPLYWQFSGPQSYHSVLHGDNAGNSPRALIEFAGRSLFGDPETAGRLSLNTTEQNAFYGWPLLAFGAIVCVWMWRSRLVRALAVTGVVAAVLSLGPLIPVPRTDLTLPGPWRWIIKLPLFESVIEGRVAMVCAPVLGILLALALDRITAAPAREHRRLGLLAVAAVLLPVLPLPLAVRDRAPVPVFITSGAWKDYVKDGESLVAVPLPDPGLADALRWQVKADFGFKLAGGYYNGPWGPDRIGIYGAPPRHLSNLLRDVRYGAEPPAVGPEWQAQARRDLSYWKAGAVVVPEQDRSAELVRTLTDLLGTPPRKVRDVWVWRVGRN